MQASNPWRGLCHVYHYHWFLVIAAVAYAIPLSALLANDFFPHELRSGTESVGLQDDLDGVS